jgi:polyisoprenoid-binding protein YceI
MNHITLAIAGMLAIAAALIGTVGISIAVQSAAAASYTRDPSRNSIDFENSQTDFSFKQKLKNNCSGFITCCNTASETLAGLASLEPRADQVIRCVIR